MTQYPRFSFGLAINPEEKIEDLSHEYNFNDFPLIQIMTVHTGFQGTEFLPESLNKIEQLRTLHYRNKVSLDGGVNKDSLAAICKAPARPDYLAVGHYLIAAENSEIEERIRLLKTSC